MSFIDCAICLEQISNAHTLPCGHNFHIHCINALKNSTCSQSCPLCRQKLPTQHRKQIRRQTELQKQKRKLLIQRRRDNRDERIKKKQERKLKRADKRLKKLACKLIAEQKTKRLRRELNILR